jgi:hypothetical protein
MLTKQCPTGPKVQVGRFFGLPDIQLTGQNFSYRLAAGANPEQAVTPFRFTRHRQLQPDVPTDGSTKAFGARGPAGRSRASLVH